MFPTFYYRKRIIKRRMRASHAFGNNRYFIVVYYIVYIVSNQVFKRSARELTQIEYFFNSYLFSDARRKTIAVHFDYVIYSAAHHAESEYCNIYHANILSL
ncbi:hypothetical protein SDC9_155112 [bioreactor metagenome]|uniref:Uncharacterized protein n=1 Tax=bioreactor metagenome TaxID=1076179 RepID=A0A645F241_9ZZZZ